MIHIVETDIVELVVEIESFGMSSDKFNEEIVSVDELQLKQADLSCVHALNKLHFHEIHVSQEKFNSFPKIGTGYQEKDKNKDNTGQNRTRE
ncbi:hypothetical protein Tco_1531627 [Tanacetum coccineum]